MTDILPSNPLRPTLDALRAQPLSEHIYFAGGALKGYDDGTIGGYLVVFTGPEDRDSWKEFFTASTNYWLDWYKSQPILYHHGQNDEAPIPIGIITSITKDACGLYARGMLDINHDDLNIRYYARRALEQVNKGQLYWSSGSISHMVRVTDEGEIIEWPIGEGSLTPKPAETRGRTQVNVLRAAMKSLLDEYPETPTPPNLEDSATTRLPEPSAKESSPVRVSSTRKLVRGTPMTNRTKMDSMVVLTALDNVGTLDDATKLAIVRELAALETGEEVMEGEGPAMNAAPPPPPPPAPPTPPAPDPAMASGRSSVDAKAVARELLKQMRTAPAQPLPGGGGQNPATPAPSPHIQVRTKYHGLSAEDMAFLNSRRKLVAVRSGDAYVPDAAFIREIADKAQRSLRAGGMKTLDEDTANRVLAIKDNELDNTGVAATAGNWVPTLWTADIWPRVRVENNVAKSLRTIEMPSNTFEVPVENADPTVNKVPETTNRSQLTLDSTSNPIPDSLLSAGKTTLVAAKLGLRVGFSDEDEEDSIVPFIPQLREQSMKAMMNAVDSVILNGDTATGNAVNINDIAGTPAATDKFLVFNGARKLALVTNTTVTVNAGGASPTLQMFRQARFKMQSLLNVYSLYPASLVMFCDPQTYGKVLNIDELNVWMNNGRNATVNTGQVPMIDGVELYPSEQLLAANSAGKVDLDTVGNNTTGTIVFMARMGWTLGYRRQVKTSVDFLPYYDSYQMTATIRLALAYQDTVASAVIYNIGI